MDFQIRALGVALMLGVGCGSGGGEDPADGSDEGGAFDSGEAPGCPDGAEPFAPAAMRPTVDFLASSERAGRAPGTAGDRAARSFIEARFECLGLDPAYDGFAQPFRGAGGTSTANVVALLRGGDPAVADEVIVVGAHHDHLGVAGGEVFAGANDNASGVATVLAVAQRLAERSAPPRRTVVFAAFGDEESALNGAKHYVAHPPAGAGMDQTVFMVNLDMVGTYAQEGVVYALDAGPGTVGRAAVEAARAVDPDLNVDLDEVGEDSDGEIFCAAGVPEVFFFTEDPACYHKACDTPGHLDYPGLSRVAALVGATVIELADGDLDLRAARDEGCEAP